MKRIITVSLSLLFSATWSFALNSVAADSTIVSHLQNNKSGGKVTIVQNKQLEAKLGRKGNSLSINKIRDVNYLVAQGYRIQVFSGNSQRKSKEEAEKKEAMIKNVFSELDTYVSLKSPFWRLRVGNYRTLEEADQQLRQLRKEFPSFGKEMYIVRDEVLFPLKEF